MGIVSEERFEARVRGSRDGVIWGEWRAVELGHEGGSLVWFDEGVRFVETMGDGPMRLLFIEPGRGKAAPGPS